MPTVSAVGVASPRAQGHATQMTAMAGMSDCRSSPAGPSTGGTKRNHARNVMRAMARIAGTNTAAMRSAMR